MIATKKLWLTAVVTVGVLFAVLLVSGCSDNKSGDTNSANSPTGNATGRHHRIIDFKAASEKLGVSENRLQAVFEEATKSRPPDIAWAATTLNVSESVLRDALGIPAHMGGGGMGGHGGHHRS